MVAGGIVCVVTVLLLLLLVIMVLILVHKRRARQTEKERKDPLYDDVLSPHMPANTADNTTETVTIPQVQPNIAYGMVFHY